MKTSQEVIEHQSSLAKFTAQISQNKIWKSCSLHLKRHAVWSYCVTINSVQFLLNARMVALFLIHPVTHMVALFLTREIDLRDPADLLAPLTAV